MAQLELVPPHQEGLRLWQSEGGDDSLGHVWDVHVRCLGAEPRRLSIRIRVKISQERVCVVYLSVRHGIEPDGKPSSYGLGRERAAVHDHIRALDARVDAAEKVRHPLSLALFWLQDVYNRATPSQNEKCRKGSLLITHGQNMYIYPLHSGMLQISAELWRRLIAKGLMKGQ